MKQQLWEKGIKIVYRDLVLLEELEAVEHWESEAVIPASSVFNEVEVDWSAVDLSSLGPVNLGALDKTIKLVVGSLSNS